MALRRPSARTVDLYNQLIQKQNKVRSVLRKIHKEAEQASGAGRLPALVVPKSSHKVRPNYFNGLTKAQLQLRLKRFYESYRNLRESFGGKDPLRRYIAKTVTSGYRDLFKDLIGIEPASPGFYSKSQRIHATDAMTAKYMDLYNKMFHYGNEMQFYKLLITGHIIEFKWFYREFMYGSENENAYVDQQLEEWDRFSSIEERMKLDKSLESISPELSRRIHKSSTITKAQNKRMKSLIKSVTKGGKQ